MPTRTTRSCRATPEQDEAEGVRAEWLAGDRVGYPMSVTTSTSAPLVGATLGDRYEVVRHIARGGMGDVYEAQDTLLRRPVAVKVYRATAGSDRGRFEAEVRTL